MTTEEPRISPNGRYPIGKAAELLGMNRNYLRRLTEQGKIKCGFARGTLRKVYPGTALLAYWRTH